MKAPVFSLGPRDRLWLILKARVGKYTSYRNLMFDAGFIVSRRDRVTPYTSFHWHLEQLKSSAPRDGYHLSEEAGSVMLVKSKE